MLCTERRESFSHKPVGRHDYYTKFNRFYMLYIVLISEHKHHLRSEFKIGKLSLQNHNNLKNINSSSKWSSTKCIENNNFIMIDRKILLKSELKSEQMLQKKNFISVIILKIYPTLLGIYKYHFPTKISPLWLSTDNNCGIQLILKIILFHFTVPKFWLSFVYSVKAKNLVSAMKARHITIYISQSYATAAATLFMCRVFR